MFEIGNYLGGGAAGTVYEAEYSTTKENYALKILNPLGYKLVSPSLLRKYTIIIKGKIFDVASESSNQQLTKDHVWWLLNGSTKQYLAAYFLERENSLRELSLKECAFIWGVNHDCRL